MTTIVVSQVLPPLPPMRERLPQLAARLEAQGIDPSVPTRRRVFATRRLAREFIATCGVPPGLPGVRLDFKGVEVASVPFLHELLTTWPDVEPESMNEDVAVCWAIVKERTQSDQ